MNENTPSGAFLAIWQGLCPRDWTRLGNGLEGPVSERPVLGTWLAAAPQAQAHSIGTSGWNTGLGTVAARSEQQSPKQGFANKRKQ